MAQRVGAASIASVSLPNMIAMIQPAGLCSQTKHRTSSNCVGNAQTRVADAGGTIDMTKSSSGLRVDDGLMTRPAAVPRHAAG